MKINHSVIICDDDQGILEVCKIVVENLGYRTVVAENARQLFQALKKIKPSLILLDLRMPGMSGEEVVAKLKKDKTMRRMPIIIVSANHDAKKIAKNIGADGVLAKPFDISDLEHILRSHIKASA